LGGDGVAPARLFFLVIPAKAGLRRQDAGANIRAANGPKGTRQESRVIQLSLLKAFPRKRESILIFALVAQGFHSPCGRAGNFLCLCKESHQRNTPPVARSPGILPSECANAFRGSLSAHPCAHSELARILRAPLRAFPPRVRRATGGPVRAASCRRSNGKGSPSHGRSAIMDCRSFYRCAFHHSRAASLALNCCSGGLQPQAKITRCKSLSLEFAESKLRLSPVRANPTAFVHKLRALPNDRAILRKDEGINEQAIKFQPDGLFDSSFVVGVTVTTQ